MRKHEIFKEICDTIGYDVFQNEIFEDGGTLFWSIGIKGSSACIVDVREIIFTREFMQKFIEYRGFQIKDWKCAKNNWIHMCLLQLDDPTTYLYDLLGLFQLPKNS